MGDFRLEQFKDALAKVTEVPPAVIGTDPLTIAANEWLRQLQYHVRAYRALVGNVSVNASKMVVSDKTARALEDIYTQLDALPEVQ